MDETERIVRQYYDDILRYFIVRTRDRTSAEDLTQETFLRWIRWGRDVCFPSEKKRRAYLYAIASNLCTDYFASHTPTEPVEEDIPAPEKDHDLSVVLEAALGRLPDAQREAAMLYYYSGFKVKEIAQIQNATVSAVKSRLKLARDSLRQILSDKEGLF